MAWRGLTLQSAAMARGAGHFVQSIDTEHLYSVTKLVALFYGGIKVHKQSVLALIAERRWR
jgi:hypothetical protein